MRHVLIACAAVVALAIPGAAISAGHARAAASTYTVLLGEQGPPPAAIKKLKLVGGMNQFMPSKLVIAAGDKVTFSSGSFHTVTYNPKPIPPFMPDPAKGTYAGLVDAAGTPFYFADLGKFIYNPQAFGPFGPKTISGSTPVSSGALSPRSEKAPPATATYTFPAPGTYHLFCTLHPGMKATVVVKAAGSAVPKTPDQVKAESLAQMTAGYAKAVALSKTSVGVANTVAVGIGSNVALLAYFPKVLKVKTGTTVTFVNKSPSEVHNITIGPKAYLQLWGKKTDMLPQGPTSPNQVTPIIPYGTDPAPFTYDGATTHGNGFFATPVISGSPIPGLARSSKVKFTAPGTYHYFCWIHGPDMSGTIVVTP